MKLLAALFALTLTAPAFAKSKAPKIYREYTSIDFVKDAKNGISLNLMDDGVVTPDGFDYVAYGIRFNLGPTEDFKITTRNEDGEGNISKDIQCDYQDPQYLHIGNGVQQISIDVDPSVETDDGSNCTYTIELDNGKKVAIRYYEEGT